MTSLHSLTLTAGLAGEYPAKRDAKYTMDELNRLMRAQGILVSGSISTTSRDERWQDGSSNLALSQTGNWTQRRLDFSGDCRGAVKGCYALASSAGPAGRREEEVPQCRVPKCMVGRC